MNYLEREVKDGGLGLIVILSAVIYPHLEQQIDILLFDVILKFLMSILGAYILVFFSTFPTIFVGNWIRSRFAEICDEWKSRHTYSFFGWLGFIILAIIYILFFIIGYVIIATASHIYL